MYSSTVVPRQRKKRVVDFATFCGVVFLAGAGVGGQLSVVCFVAVSNRGKRKPAQEVG